jgi:putative intracellular protease/amidase
LQLEIMARILIPIPSLDYDPTEVAIPWSVLSKLGQQVLFATPDGKPATADELMLSGRGLDLWGWIPLLRNLPLVGLALRANADARAAHAAMLQSSAFQNPLRWDALRCEDFDALLLPGGHRARGMRPYLESAILQNLAVEFFRANKPVAAICHGPLLLARSVDPHTGHSVLYGRKTTCLTWKLEKSAAMVGRFMRFWDPHYYRTYLESAGQTSGFMSVQHEITRALKTPADFQDVARDDADYWRKTSGLFRDSQEDQRAAFVVQDGQYISARWPGDVHALAQRFNQALIEGR